jgi:hypothetical protein
MGHPQLLRATKSRQALASKVGKNSGVVVRGSTPTVSEDPHEFIENL